MGLFDWFKSLFGSDKTSTQFGTDESISQLIDVFGRWLRSKGIAPEPHLKFTQLLLAKFLPERNVSRFADLSSEDVNVFVTSWIRDSNGQRREQAAISVSLLAEFMQETRRVENAKPLIDAAKDSYTAISQHSRDDRNDASSRNDKERNNRRPKRPRRRNRSETRRPTRS